MNNIKSRSRHKTLNMIQNFFCSLLYTNSFISVFEIKTKKPDPPISAEAITATEPPTAPERPTTTETTSKIEEKPTSELSTTAETQLHPWN